MARQHDRRQRSDKEQFWREKLLLWQTSGQTIRAFCDAQRLSEPSFYAWRRRFVAQRGQQQPAFVPVRVTPTPTTSIPLELVLASGRVVRVPPGFDADTLRQLLTVLHDLPEDASC
jgi:transposase